MRRVVGRHPHRNDPPAPLVMRAELPKAEFLLRQGADRALLVADALALLVSPEMRGAATKSGGRLRGGAAAAAAAADDDEVDIGGGSGLSALSALQGALAFGGSSAGAEPGDAGGNGGLAVSVAAAKARLLAKIAKRHIVDNVLPIALGLRQLLRQQQQQQPTRAATAGSRRDSSAGSGSSGFGGDTSAPLPAGVRTVLAGHTLAFIAALLEDYGDDVKGGGSRKRECV